MPRKPKALVLESWAVLAYLGGEATGQEVADLITSAHETRIPMYMSIINAGRGLFCSRSLPQPDRAPQEAALRRGHLGRKLSPIRCTRHELSLRLARDIPRH